MYNKMRNLEMILLKYSFSNGIVSFSFIDYGCTLTSLKFYDAETLVTYDNENDYLNNQDYYLNAIIGPTAGRVENAQYRIGSKVRSFVPNNGKNMLHGGFDGLCTKTFQVSKISNGFICIYEDEEAKYQATLSVDKSDFVIKYVVLPKISLAINMTHHCYFNLNHNNTVMNQYLKVNATKVLELKDGLIPNGKFLDVKNTPFDFIKRVQIGDRLTINHSQYEITRNIDHPFVIDSWPMVMDNGDIQMSISSDCECVVMYFCNYFADVGKVVNGIKGVNQQGVAIEPQDYPNGMNLTLGKNQIYNVNDRYEHEIKYSFSKLNK